MKTIAIANQKGGVGKTSLCSWIAGGLSERGQRVLMVDIDTQASLSGMFVENYRERPQNVFHVLTDEGCDVSDVITHTAIEYIDILPSSPKMSRLEAALDSPVDAFFQLKDSLEDVQAEYDIILIDCPPKLDLANTMGLVAADGVLIPIECQQLAFTATTDMLNEIETIKKRLNKSLELLGFVINKYVSSRKIEQEFNKALRKAYGKKVFKTEFRNYVQYTEAATYGKPITHSHPSSVQAETCREFIDELYRVAELTQPPVAA